MLAKCDAEAQSGTESIARVRLRAAGYRSRRKTYLGSDTSIYSLGTASYSNAIRRPTTAANNSPKTHAVMGSHFNSGTSPRRYRLKRILNEWPSVLAEIRAFTSKDRHRRRGADPTPT